MMMLFWSFFDALRKEMVHGAPHDFQGMLGLPVSRQGVRGKEGLVRRSISNSSQRSQLPKNATAPAAVLALGAARAPDPFAFCDR